MNLLFSTVAVLSLGLMTQAPPPATQAPAERRPRPASTHIVVRDKSGTPLEGVHLVITGPAKREATTDADGAVVLSGLRDGTYRVRFEHEGFLTLEREIVVRTGVPRDIDVALSAAPRPPAPPPPPEPAPPRPAPAPAPAPSAANGSPVTVSIPAYLDKNFIGGKDPLKESVIGCTAGATTKLLQIREPVAQHTHADLDETLYIVAGEGAVRIRDEATAVSAGSLSVIPRGLPHSIERRGRNPLIAISTLAGTPCQAPETTQANK